MAKIQKSLTEMTTLLEQAGKKKEKHSCKWLDWLPDFDLIVMAKWIVLVLLIVAALLGMGYGTATVVTLARIQKVSGIIPDTQSHTKTLHGSGFLKRILFSPHSIFAVWLLLCNKLLRSIENEPEFYERKTDFTVGYLDVFADGYFHGNQFPI